MMLLDAAGGMVVDYTVDAWGRVYAIDGSMADTLGILNPLIYRGYVYDHETGLYYLNSRYYDPAIGRFLNADVLVSTGQGLLGNNMFAYCRNNPVRRVDITGMDDMDCLGNDTKEDFIYKPEGGSSIGGTGIPVGCTGSHSTAGTSGLKIVTASSGNSMAIAGAPAGEKTEVHHIVEQCQIRKSGFSSVDIQGYSNKVELPYSVHRKISGFYSSKTPDSGNLRVRDWLAGQPFDFQQKFGWQVIEQFWSEVYGD